MKILVILIVTILAVLSNNAAADITPITNITEFIENEGYPVQNVTVLTNDGYILDLFRIPGPRSFKEQWDNSNQEKPGRNVVLLMHGLLGSADEFVAGGRSRGLAFKLADRGFDVFLGNVRGSKYGRQHTQLLPNEDSQFWNFCWEDIGLTDLPAIIDLVTVITGENKMHYIGYNQGNTIFYVLASEKPEYNSKIKKMIALGPTVFTEHAHHPLMAKIRANLGTHWITKNLGTSEFAPSVHLKNEIKLDCLKKNIDEQVCDNFYFLVNGYSRHLNQTIVPQLAAKVPYGVPIKSMLHYAELLKTGNFASYVAKSSDSNSSSDSTSDASLSYSSEEDIPNQASGKSYDLESVIVDNYVLYVPKDEWSNQRDVNHLLNLLPNVIEATAFKQYSSNVDLLIAKNAYDNVHEKIMNILL